MTKTTNHQSWLYRTILVVPLAAIALGAMNASADDEIEGGKKLFEREWTYEAPLKLAKNDGENESAFITRLTKLPGDGLGPMFNATSCEACHAKGGGAGVERNVTLLTLDPRSDALKNRRFSGEENDANMKETRRQLLKLYPALLSPGGQLAMDIVVHEASARPFYHEIRRDVGRYIPGGAPDQWFISEKRTIDAIANQPVLAGRMEDLDYYLSQRNSPPLFGLGMIDRVDRDRLPIIARAQDIRTGGRVTGRVGAGIFGWRAQTPTLEAFVRGACAGEVGLQLERTPQASDAADKTYVSLGEDLDHKQVNMLVSYVRSLPTPTETKYSGSQAAFVREGKKLFSTIGCSICHVANVYPARGIYSDLLLHDMGSLLQAPSPSAFRTISSNIPAWRMRTFPRDVPDSLRRGPFSRFAISGYYGSPSFPQPYELESPNEPRFPRGRVPEEVLTTRKPTEVTWDLLQREWRTPPLWGVADSAPYLHDGRAETLDAAIRWHGGEATDATSEYRALSNGGRMRVVAFLKSLRAPVPSRPISTPDKTVSNALKKNDVPEELAAVMEVFRLDN